eukprot:471136-Alexandrium_andersonii.AAC.1
MGGESKPVTKFDPVSFDVDEHGFGLQRSSGQGSPLVFVGQEVLSVVPPVWVHPARHDAETPLQEVQQRPVCAPPATPAFACDALPDDPNQFPGARHHANQPHPDHAVDQTVGDPVHVELDGDDGRGRTCDDRVVVVARGEVSSIDGFLDFGDDRWVLRQ